MATTTTTSVKQKCFSIVESHPGRCFLYIYGKETKLFTEDSEILSCLRDARFGSNFCLVYRDARDIRHAIYVLVDTRDWLRISECMSSLLYKLTKDKS